MEEQEDDIEATFTRDDAERFVHSLAHGSDMSLRAYVKLFCDYVLGEGPGLPTGWNSDTSAPPKPPFVPGDAALRENALKLIHEDLEIRSLLATTFSALRRQRAEAKAD